MDHIDKERAWAIFRITKLFVKNFHDSKASIKTNEVSQSKRTHRYVCSEFHSLIDILWSTNTLIKSKTSFIDVRHEDSVSNETWYVSCSRAGLSHAFSQFQSALVSFITSLKCSDNFNKLHNWNGVHEMHTNDLVSAIWNNTSNL